MRGLLTLTAAAVCLALAACSKPAVPTEGACPNCNVILISLDTVRADHLGAYGNGKKVSPNFDRLAKKSVLFERAVSQTAWTLPGHGSMMTGLYPKRLGVEHYPPTRRLPEVPMLAEQFKAAGYATAAFTGGGFVSDHWGFDRGFDIYSSDGRRFEHNIDEAMSWLRNNSERKFFLFLHGYDAHRPYYSTAEDKKAVGLGAKRAKELSGFCGRENRQAPPPAQLEVIKKFYDASIRHGDVAFGQYLETFEELGLMENTVILVTSDHGEEFFEHGNCDHVRFLYQEVVGVPYLIYVPGMTPKGDRTSEIVPASISVAPTLLELAGIEHNMPGPSVVPVLNGERDVFRGVYSHTDSVLGKLGSRGETIALTTPTGKLISYLEEGTDEAYNTAVDRGEQQVLPEGDEAYARRQTLHAWNDALVRLSKPSGRGLVSGRKPAADAPAAKPSADKKAAAKKPGKGAGPGPGKKPADEEEAEEIPEEIRKQLESLGYLD
jgi:arylsulfatase A-like enzyme